MSRPTSATADRRRPTPDRAVSRASPSRLPQRRHADSNAITSSADVEAPYLTHSVRHFGRCRSSARHSFSQVTLVPPMNMGRMRSERRASDRSPARSLNRSGITMGSQESLQTRRVQADSAETLNDQRNRNDRPNQTLLQSQIANQNLSTPILANDLQDPPPTWEAYMNSRTGHNDVQTLPHEEADSVSHYSSDVQSPVSQTESIRDLDPVATLSAALVESNRWRWNLDTEQGLPLDVRLARMATRQACIDSLLVSFQDASGERAADLIERPNLTQTLSEGYLSAEAHMAETPQVPIIVSPVDEASLASSAPIQGPLRRMPSALAPDPLLEVDATQMNRPDQVPVSELELLVQDLDEMPEGPEQYETLSRLTELVGPAPTAGSTNLALRYGTVELTRRRTTQSGQIKVKLSLFNVPVDRCVACLSQLREGDEASLTTCKHALHTACATRWFVHEAKRQCPQCRASQIVNTT